MQIRLIVEGQAQKPELDQSLVRLLANAQRFHTLLVNGKDTVSMTEIAREAGVSASYFTRVLRLHYLSPDIKTMILQGKQPYHLTAKSLMMTSPTELPLKWADQNQMLTG